MRNLFKGSLLTIKKYTPVILTGASVVGVVSTTILAVKATPKAVKLLEEKKHEELNNIEVIKTVLPVYIPTIVSAAATITCIIGVHVTNRRHQAALISAYTMLNNSFKQYKAKVVDIYGPEASDKIREEIAKDVPVPKQINENKILFYDEYSKRYFESTMYKVQQAEYRLNRDLTMRDYAYLNEFYEALDIPAIDAGWELGWSVGACSAMYWQNWIDFSHKKVTMEDGTECIHIIMFQEPIIGFEDYE